MSKAALIKGVRNIRTAAGPVVVEIDEQWKVKMNGHDNTEEDIPPLSAQIFKDDILVGIVGPFQSAFVNADEYQFVKACEATYKVGRVIEQIELELN